VLTQASIFGSVVFTVARSPFDNSLGPQLVSARGMSEGTWELKRPVWEGDTERERERPAKRMRVTKRGEEEKRGLSVDDLVNS
jgi:hypothetical protein